MREVASSNQHPEPSRRSLGHGMFATLFGQASARDDPRPGADCLDPGYIGPPPIVLAGAAAMGLPPLMLLGTIPIGPPPMVLAGTIPAKVKNAEKRTVNIVTVTP
jgi:hypothetical protein